jgi:transaldolase
MVAQRIGELRRPIEEDGLRGMTSNPAIFEKAIAGWIRCSVSTSARVGWKDICSPGGTSSGHLL